MLHHYKGDSHCTKSSSHCTCMRTHTTTTYKLSLATRVPPRNNETLPFIYIQDTHTGSISTCISCAPAACLCHRIGCLSLSLRIFSHETPTADSDTSISLSSQRSIKCIDNLLLPSQADLFPSVTPQQKCHTLHINKSVSVCHPLSQLTYSLGMWGWKGGGGELRREGLYLVLL